MCINTVIVGCVNVNLLEYPNGKPKDVWLPLKPRPGKKDKVTGGMNDASFYGVVLMDYVMQQKSTS